MGQGDYAGREIVTLDGGTGAGKLTQKRARRKDGFGKAKQEAFLQKLSETANVRLASHEVDINPSSAYRLRRRDAAFSDQWDAALKEGVRTLEMELLRRSIEGDSEPVYYGGKQVGERTSYPDRVALYLIGRHGGASERDGAPPADKTSLEYLRHRRDKAAALRIRLAAEIEAVEAAGEDHCAAAQEATVSPTRGAADDGTG
ncbi:hypothetical protein B5C34_07025 [Pacificimonas flava]|uniref:Terminase small subunit n=2 Tax=Pacificimonas TaxID=1960290 RepID=A0A219B4X0_9SPHN|nr:MULTISPECIES: hypothetical protein [Pacificimonas]MBZ6377023.1 hypothetical protein [Pacificimonas aurantium]OWV33234.1 hypothetical protein B5C34_07025 [Pacificimonas flava]